MKNKLRTIRTSMLALAGILYAGAAEAKGTFLDAVANLDRAGRGAGSPTDDLGAVVGTGINVVLGLVGLIFLVLMVYAGILWMTAQGKDEQVEKARKMIISTILGLIIVLSAYAITYFVTSRF